jgi:hypothetical protein
LKNIPPHFTPEVDQVTKPDNGTGEDQRIYFPVKHVEDESLYLVQQNFFRKKLQQTKKTLQWKRQSSNYNRPLKGAGSFQSDISTGHTTDSPQSSNSSSSRSQSSNRSSPESSNSSGHTTIASSSSYDSESSIRHDWSKDRLSVANTKKTSCHSAVSPVRLQARKRLFSWDANGTDHAATSFRLFCAVPALAPLPGKALSLVGPQPKQQLSYNYCLKQCVRGERLVISLTIPTQQKPVSYLDGHGQSVEALPSMLTVHTTYREGVSQYGLIGMEWASTSPSNPVGLQHQMHKDLAAQTKHKGGIQHARKGETKNPIRQPHLSAFLFSHPHLCFTGDRKLNKHRIKQLMKLMKCNTKSVGLPQCPPPSAIQ